MVQVILIFLFSDIKILYNCLDFLFFGNKSNAIILIVIGPVIVPVIILYLTLSKDLVIFL